MSGNRSSTGGRADDGEALTTHASIAIRLLPRQVSEWLPLCQLIVGCLQRATAGGAESTGTRPVLFIPAAAELKDCSRLFSTFRFSGARSKY